MRSLSLLTTSSLAVFAMACGASQAPSGSLTKDPNAPEWVHRGSRVMKGSLFGVGTAGGIKNTELARTTASNRGRAEISKILETYSASLMKDYQASTTAGDMKASSEEQHVESAIKTFSAKLLKGTEVKEYWLDADRNIWFALIELNFERAKVLATVDTDDNMKKWIDNNGGRVLDDMADKEPPPPSEPPPASEPPASKPPPVATTPPPASKPAPAADPGPETVVGGTTPPWTKGQCDSDKYLCGAGHGGDRTAADLDARAELARIFKANIQAVATSFEAAGQQISSKTGETWEETQQVSRFSMVSTDKVVTMSQILYRWDDGKSTKWSLAVIDRAQASAALRDQIESKDSLIRSKVGTAKAATDKLKRFTSIKGAIAVLAEREALNADLRVIDKSGRGIPPPHDIGELTSMLDAAADSLSIGVVVSGTASDRVQACLEEALTAKGYQVQAAVTEDDDEPELAGSFDVLIKGKVKAQSRGKIAGGDVVNTTLSLKVINGKTNRVIKTYTASKKATRGDLKSAASTSVHQLCLQKINGIVSAIDSAFSK